MLWAAAGALVEDSKFCDLLGEMYQKKKAVARLTQELPGTAEIGNWGIIKGCRKVGLRCDVILNKRTWGAAAN